MYVRTFGGGRAINFFTQNSFQIIWSNFLFLGGRGSPHVCTYFWGGQKHFHSESISDHFTCPTALGNHPRSKKLNFSCEFQLVNMSLAAQMTRLFLLGNVPIDLPVKEFSENSNPGQRYGPKRIKKSRFRKKRIHNF